MIIVTDYLQRVSSNAPLATRASLQLPQLLRETNLRYSNSQLGRSTDIFPTQHQVRRNYALICMGFHDNGVIIEQPGQ